MPDVFQHKNILSELLVPGGVLSSNTGRTLLKHRDLEMDFSGTLLLLLRVLAPEALAQFATAGTSRLCEAEGRRTADVHCPPASRHPAREGEGCPC